MKKNLISLAILIGLGYAVYHLFSNSDSSSLGKKALSDFAISDTSQVGSIIIDDSRHIVELKRGEGKLWSLNDTMIAMPHHVDLLLRTFATVGVQSPVSKVQRQTAIRIIMGDTRKVKILDKEGKWIKTWYVGRATQNNQGTFALLETPEDGLSDQPYIIEVRGFRGFLTTRFHADIKEWRWTGLFYYPDLDFKSVKVETPRDKEFGFHVDVIDRFSGEFLVKDHEGNEIEKSKPAIAAFLGNFKQINVEHFNLNITPAQEDSILNTPPAFRISVTDKTNEVKSADIYFRKPPPALAERMGARTPEFDPERVFVYFDGDLAYGQRLTFDKILYTIKDF
jgi:hypothetical protein